MAVAAGGSRLSAPGPARLPIRGGDLLALLSREFHVLGVEVGSEFLPITPAEGTLERTQLVLVAEDLGSREQCRGALVSPPHVRRLIIVVGIVLGVPEEVRVPVLFERGKLNESIRWVTLSNVFQQGTYHGVESDQCGAPLV